MSRVSRLLVLAVLLALALPAQAGAPAPQRPSGAQLAPTAADPEGPLQLGLQVDPEQPDAGTALVHLRLAAQVALEGLGVLWEAPQGVEGIEGTPEYAAALAPGSPTEWAYRVPVAEEGCGAFAVRAYARTADGAPVEAHLRGWLTPGPGGYEIKIDEPAEAPAAAPRAVEPLGGGGDPYEPDDTYAQASTAVVGTIYPGHDFHTDGDVDWSKFTAVAGKSYAIELLNLGCRCNPGLVLYQPNGTTVISSEYSRRFILWTAPSGGVYYVKVSPQEAAGIGNRSSYSLRVRAFANAPDAYEADNSAGTARKIALGTSYRHTFHTTGDVDWSVFKGAAGAYYKADVLNLGPYSRPILSVYADDGLGGLTLMLHGDQHVTWRAGAATRYYVVAQNNPSYSLGDLMGPNTRYYLRVARFTPAKDAYEVDDSYVGARTVAFGVRYRHNAHVAADEDWMKVTAVAGAGYLVDLPYYGRYAGSHWMLYVYQPDHVTEVGHTPGSSLAWTAPVTGTYYLRMVHDPMAPYGPGSEYDLRITGPDSFEPDGCASLATPLAVGSTSPPHTLVAAGDQDWFSFQGRAGKAYAFDALTDGYPYPQLSLYNPAGDLQLLSGGRHLAWRAPYTYTYRVRVSAPTPVRTYRLRIQALSATPDGYEPDDGPAQSKPMALGTAYKHSFHHPTDPDWMHFHSTAGTSYAIRGSTVGPYSEPGYHLRNALSVHILDPQYTYSVDWGWTAPDSNIYYFEAANASSSLFGAGSEYTLKIAKYTPNTDTFDYGAGDSDAAHATAYGSSWGWRQTHTFHVSYDKDWVSVYLQSGTAYRFETLNLGCGNDTYLYLYDTDHATILAEDDDSGPGLASRIDWTPEASGTYYVMAKRWGDLPYGPGQEYELRITRP